MKKTILATILLLLVSCLFSNSAFASNTTNVKTRIVKHALELGIDPALALSIAKKESGFCHEKRSRHGAVGVFQLKPATAKALGYNAYELNDNIKGGLTYYKMMYTKFGSTELALAAYNAGPGNVKKYNGVPPFAETKRFVKVIMKDYKDLKSDPTLREVRQGIPSGRFNGQGARLANKPSKVKSSSNSIPSNSISNDAMPEKVLSLYMKQKNTITY